MIQFAGPLPPDFPICVERHHPQLVQTRGRPLGSPSLSGRVSHTWHVECALCQTAAVPHPSKAIAESRWREEADTYRISLSDLCRARMAVAANHAA